VPGGNGISQFGAATSPPINENKSAVNLQNSMPTAGLPQRIKFTCDNSSGSAAATYLFFDAIGMVASAASISGDAPTASALSHGIIKDYLQTNSIVFAGMRLQATSSATQFNNPFYLYEADLDGGYHAQPFFLDDAISGDKYDEKIQNYRMTFVINNRRAMTVSVAASEKLYVTFYLFRDPMRLIAK